MSFKLSFYLSILAPALLGCWQYESAEKWSDDFPDCAGELQSPIYLESKAAIFDPNLGPFHFANYDVKLPFNLTNDGHTISLQVAGFQFSKAAKNLPQISGSNFGSEIFILRQFHFHWGPNISIGSEHKIDNKTFPLEVHLVHESTAGQSAVVSFLYEINQKNNEKLKPLLKVIDKEHEKDVWKKAELRLTDMLPDLKLVHQKGYFRYLGSLTTPPCTEGVTWSVFRMTATISRQQIESFYSNVIKFNFRPALSLNEARSLFSSQVFD